MTSFKADRLGIVWCAGLGSHEDKNQKSFFTSTLDHFRGADPAILATPDFRWRIRFQILIEPARRYPITPPDRCRRTRSCRRQKTPRRPRPAPMKPSLISRAWPLQPRWRPAPRIYGVRWRLAPAIGSAERLVDISTRTAKALVTETPPATSPKTAVLKKRLYSPSPFGDCSSGWKSDRSQSCPSRELEAEGL